MRYGGGVVERCWAQHQGSNALELGVGRGARV